MASVVGVAQVDRTGGPSLVRPFAVERVQVVGLGREGFVPPQLLADTALFEQGLSSSSDDHRAVGDEALGELLANAASAGWTTVATRGPCPPEMASIDGRFCIDRYEASLVEILPDGAEEQYSPYESVADHVVRAVSHRGVFPQGYISEVQAAAACTRSGKRLCKPKEWLSACMGPEHKTYGYGDKSEPGKCNDQGRSPMRALFPHEGLSNHALWDWDRMNRPELNQVDGTLARTGDHDECTNGYGVYDMVGNLHEWVDDPNGTFQGGYYQDTQLNGDGCHYVTMAHEARYHDYSTGFRCCADTEP
jgi:hypothetical protein